MSEKKEIIEELKIIDCHAPYDEVKDKGTFTLMGGDSSNPSWDEYVDGFKEEYRPHIKLIRKAIEDNGWIGLTGENQDNENIQFRFSDGSLWGFSWRAWGDLMQAIVNKKEGYMTYYM